MIRRLVEELEVLVSSRVDVDDATATPPMRVEVRSLERWMGQGWEVSDHEDSSSIFCGVGGIVNRVSDAAPPALFKACTAILTAASLLGLPIVNGPISYSLCANKWCQHVLFQRAGLKAPPTKVFYNTVDHPATSQHDSETAKMLHGEEAEDSYVLVKPNAGGFGLESPRYHRCPKNFLYLKMVSLYCRNTYIQTKAKSIVFGS